MLALKAFTSRLADMSLSPKVLVMIPAFNEERTVGDVVKSVKDLFPDFRVVVVDDGSEDETAKRAAQAGADVVSLPFHCGGSIAIQTGYLIAARKGFDYTVKIDADGQHKPEEVSKLLAPLMKGEADITVGSRYRTYKNKDDSAVKTGGRFFSSTLVSMLRKMEITDVTSGMRAWNLKAIKVLITRYREKKVVEDSVFWVAETILASKLGLRMKEVAIEVLPRLYGKSKSFSKCDMLMYPVRLITTLIEEIVS
jgi:hypothetical protein